MRAVAAAVILAMLAGCTVGPDFKRPPAPPVQSYTAAPLPPRTVAAAAPGGAAQTLAAGEDIPAQWWTLFHSTELNALIEQALKANPDLAAAQAALRQARENAAAESGALFPQVDLAAGATRQRESGASLGQPGGSSVFNLFNASVNVSYAPDVFGGVRRQIESLDAQADYQRFLVEATYLSLTANLVTAAVQEASLRGQIAATEDMLAAERKQLGVLQRQFELGAGTRPDILAQQSEVAQTEASLPPLRKQLSATRNQLLAYIGHYPSQDVAGRFELSRLELPQTLPVSLPSRLVEQRPDLREAEAQLHTASANLGVAIANRLPQFKLTAGYGGAAIDAGSVLSPANAVWNLGINLAQPIFEGGTLLHRERAAEAAFVAAREQYRSTALHAFQDVSNALRALELDAVALQAQVAAERSAAQSFDIARQQYALGAIPYLTLLNAERTEQQARINLVQAEANRYADTAALFQALGGGWWNRADLASGDAASDEPVN